MKPIRSTRHKITYTLTLIVLTLAGLMTACDPTIPPLPDVTIIITAVENSTALAQDVANALTGTAVINIGMTETVFAQGGVTLTPSNTPTPTPTLTPSPTRFVTTTYTPAPPPTATPTYEPFASNTPAPPPEGDETGWIRVLHSWREIEGGVSNPPVDVFINNERVTRSLEIGQATNYFQVQPGAVRLALWNVIADVSAPITTPPLTSTVVDVPPGGVVSVVAANLGEGLRLVPLVEDPTPLESGESRLTVLNANPVMLPVNALLTSVERAVAYNFNVGQQVGSFDLPSDSYVIDLYDVEDSTQLLSSLSSLQLVNRVSYILVLATPLTGGNLTDALLFSGITRRIGTDLGTRFINLAFNSGPQNIAVDGEPQISLLQPGLISEPIPVSSVGALLRVTDAQGRETAKFNFGPFAGADADADKVVLLYDGLAREDYVAVNSVVVSQNAPRSLINANIRLIHALQDTRPLSLEIRPVRTTTTFNPLSTPETRQLDETEIPWVPVTQGIEFGTASAYVGRTPEIFDVRVLLAGTRSVVGQYNAVQLLPGGVYDFVALPGGSEGSAELVLLQPDVQLASIAAGGDSGALAEAVNATLTAIAPRVTATPTRAFTPDPTATPVATNTPRPTNTPDVYPPLISVAPLPPAPGYREFQLNGINLPEGGRYDVRLDDNQFVVANGFIDGDGVLLRTVTLARDIEPGAHVLRVCVDCVPGGAAQEFYLPILVGLPTETPTATFTPTLTATAQP